MRTVLVSIVQVNDPRIDQLVCAIARKLYRLHGKELERTETELLRLLGLIRHYRRVELGLGELHKGGARHLCVDFKDP